MPDSAQPSTLRELRALLLRARSWIFFIGAAVLLALVGPFGTNDALRFVPRLAYWLGMVGVTYCVGHVVTNGLMRATQGWAARPVQIGGVALACGAVMAPVVIAYNWAVLGILPDENPLRAALTVSAVATVVTLLLASIDAPAEPEVTAPALLDRLSIEKRAPLVALSVEDHYVRVRTRAGEEMLLMRLSDAIRETTPVAGLQVHRSHWVALDAVRSARRQGDRAILSMAAGDDIPVSRANVHLVRDAGLLPRGGRG